MGQKANLIKTNFSAGEVSPLMHGRVDVTRHKNGASELLNFVVQPHGGIVRRPGSQFIAETKDSSKRSLFFPFQFSSVEAYVLEFGHLYIRVIKEGEYILDGGVPLEIVTPYTDADIFALSVSQSADVLYITHPTFYPRTLARYAEDDWQLALLQHEDGPYRPSLRSDRETTIKVSSVVHLATITSTVAEFVVGDVGKFIEYYKDGFLVIGEIKTYVSTTVVTIEPRENIVDYTSIDPQTVIDYDTARVISSLAIWSAETEYCYIKVNGTWRYMTTHRAKPHTYDSMTWDAMDTDAGMAPTMKATTGTLTLSNETITATLTASTFLFDATRDVLRHFRLSFGARNVWGWITSIAGGGTSKTASVSLGVMMPRDKRDQRNFVNNGITADWKLGAWYVDNYPSFSTIHQQRLIFANSPVYQDWVWFSMIDDYVSFATANRFAEVLDSSGITMRLGVGEVNPITWLKSGPVLLIGTAGDEFQIKASSLSEAITPTNIQITRQTSYGGRPYVRTLHIGPATLFIQRHGHSLREMTYSFEIDSFIANDLSIISEHLIRNNGTAGKNGSVLQMAYQQVPYSIIWFLCSNGKIASLTYEKQHEVFAWTLHDFGGIVESLVSIPSGLLHDDVYLIVRRTVDGATKRYIERIAPFFQPSSPTDYDGMAFLDSFIEYSGVSTTTITGLAHLEGEEVSVLANYAVHPNCTVVDGEIELDYPVTHAYVGLPFTSKLKTLGEEGGSFNGTSHGKLKKIVRVDAQLVNSIGLKYGSVEPTASTPMSFASTTPTHGSPPPLFTGFKELTDDNGFEKNPQFYIVQDQPYPLNILSLSQVVVVNE